MSDKTNHRAKEPYPYLLLALPAVSLLVLVIYTWFYFVEIPYTGLMINPAIGQIDGLFVVPEGGEFPRPGDVIVEINSMNWAEQVLQAHQPTFPPVKPGEEVSLSVLRDGQIVTLGWIIPGFNWSEFANRFLNHWYLAYVFWAFGLFALLLLSPRDLRAGLMSGFFFTLGLWIIFGTVSSSRLFYSNTLLRMTSWILLAVSLHFHWLFPRPLANLDRRVFWLIYLLCTALAFSELLPLLPATTFFYITALTVVVSLGLLLVKFWLHPDLRRQTTPALLFFPLMLMIFIPLTLLTYISGIPLLGDLGILTLVLLPLTYFYALYSRQLGGMQFRANRMSSQAVFITMVFLAAVACIAIVNAVVKDVGLLLVVSVAATALAAWAGVSWYASFQSWFERRFLGMPLPPAHLLPWYSARLAESLDTDRLAELLRTQVFPILLIRQAALVRLQSDPDRPGFGEITPLLQMQVNPQMLPTSSDLPGLLHAAGQVMPGVKERQQIERLAWARLALTLAVDGKPIGLCLLGRRDPDDAYAPAEIQLLQALMDQTALALVHIDLASRLRSILQADILRQEAERMALARELHDDLLGKMAILAQSGDWMGEDSRSLQAYQEAVQEIRRVITNLRSGALTYGLQLALEDFVEEIQASPLTRTHPVQLGLELSGDHQRYPEEVELHLFRIVQQACINALQHARPQTIQISGDFQPGTIHLKIRDDGVGFETQHSPELAQLLMQKQYGILGMMERALLIQAELSIDTAPGQGTVINVAWGQAA